MQTDKWAFLIIWDQFSVIGYRLDSMMTFIRLEKVKFGATMIQFN